MELGNITIDVAEHNYEIPEITKLLFPNLKESHMSIFKELLIEATNTENMIKISDGIYKKPNDDTFIYVTNEKRLWFINEIRFLRFEKTNTNMNDISPDDLDIETFSINLMTLSDFLTEKTYTRIGDKNVFHSRFYSLNKKLQLEINELFKNTNNEVFMFDINSKYDKFVLESVGSSLLEAALKPKQFNTKDELFSTIKSLLKDSGITQYSEKKTSGGVKPRGGYKLPDVIVDDTITINFDSVDENNKHNFYSKLNQNKIDFTRTQSGVVIIKLKDNVDSDDLLSDDAKDELQSGIYKVIGTLSQGVLEPETNKLKRSTSNAINKFNNTQKKIYTELIKHGLIYWKQQKSNYKLEKR